MNNLRHDIVRILIAQGWMDGTDLSWVLDIDEDNLFNELRFMQVEGLVSIQARGCCCFFYERHGRITLREVVILDEFCPACARYSYCGGPISKALAELEAVR